MSRSLDSYQPERLILKVTLLGGDPKIWRRVDVDGGITLHDLHYVIQCKQIAQVNYYPRQDSNL